MISKGVECYIGGMTLKESSAKAGVSESTLYKHLKRSGLSRCRRSVTAKQIDEFRRLRRAGETIASISRLYGYSVDTITRHLKPRQEHTSSGGRVYLKKPKQPTKAREKALIRQAFLLGDEPAYTSKRLGLPLSTVRYEYQQLQQVTN